MNARQRELAARREWLVKHIARQRVEFAQSMRRWKKPLHALDLGVSGLDYLRGQPVLLAGIAMGLLIVRPGRTFKWLRRGWAAWRAMRFIRRWMVSEGSIALPGGAVAPWPTTEP
ncbi:MAG: YqjK-like family protein [Burkholderiales bacterium]